MEPMKSPLPAKKEEEVKVEVKLGFFTAFRELLEGAKITRLEWEDEKTYGYMLDKILYLHKEDGDHSWIMSEADMKADDWVIVK